MFNYNHNIVGKTGKLQGLNISNPLILENKIIEINIKGVRDNPG